MEFCCQLFHILHLWICFCRQGMIAMEQQICNWPVKTTPKSENLMPIKWTKALQCTNKCLELIYKRDRRGQVCFCFLIACSYIMVHKEWYMLWMNQESLSIKLTWLYRIVFLYLLLHLPYGGSIILITMCKTYIPVTYIIVFVLDHIFHCLQKYAIKLTNTLHILIIQLFSNYFRWAKKIQEVKFKKIILEHLDRYFNVSWTTFTKLKLSQINKALSHH